MARTNELLGEVAATSGIPLRDGTFRTLESEAQRGSDGAILIPAVNENGEALPYIGDPCIAALDENGQPRDLSPEYRQPQLVIPLNGPTEFRYWNVTHRPFGYRDILRYIGAPERFWTRDERPVLSKDSEFRVGSKRPECRTCPHVEDIGSETYVSCSLKRRPSPFPACELICLAEEQARKENKPQKKVTPRKPPTFKRKTEEPKSPKSSNATVDALEAIIAAESQATPAPEPTPKMVRRRKRPTTTTTPKEAKGRKEAKPSPNSNADAAASRASEATDETKPRPAVRRRARPTVTTPTPKAIERKPPESSAEESISEIPIDELPPRKKEPKKIKRRVIRGRKKAD